ncbi:hypothetical protein ACIBF6_41285 [Streptosporangium amethystogenes]|uniref:hypothetical protein n=1 Tax=Streptosporangium amethystogenes TaxID=2002 RepID=UPI0037B25B9C
MDTELPRWMRRALSEPRLAPYLRLSGGDAAQAERLYYWNLEVASAFYGPLHFLEISLRNAFHRILTAKFDRPDWWEAAPLAVHSERQVCKAAEHTVTNVGSRRPTVPDDIVAELNFGFWVSLISRRYDRHLWVPALHAAFHDCPEARRDLHDGLLSLVLFRNRIMHHEPVHTRDLAADYAKLCRMLGYLEPEAAGLLPQIDRVAEALSRRASVCAGLLTPRL